MDTPSFQTSAVHPTSPSQTVTIYAGDRELLAEWESPPGAMGVVILAEGIGGSRRNPKDQYVARVLRQSGMATLLLDLLTEEEQHRHGLSHARHFDIPLLTERLVRATRWVESQSARPQLKIGYFASSTGAAAALESAARFGRKISAIVSRGGRPDLAMAALPKVVSPTLLIVGSHDDLGIQFNRTAERRLSCESDLFLLAGATHWFTERGSIEEVAGHSARWFNRHFQQRK